MNPAVLRRAAIWVGVIVAVVAAGPFLLVLLSRWFGGIVAGSLVGDIKRAIGLNPWQEFLLLVLLTAVGAVAVRLMMSWKERRIMAGGALLTISAAAVYGYLWHQTREDWFSAEGKPLKCYLLQGRSIKVRDLVPFDPDTGASCSPVTQELSLRLKAWQKAGGIDGQAAFEPIKYRPKQYFSTFVEGEAVIWYFRRPDGKIDLFDMPGFHPIYGAALLPVTLAIVEQVEKSFRPVEASANPKQSAANSRRAEVHAVPSQTVAPPTTALPAEDARLARYVNVDAIPKNAIGVAFQGDNDLARQIIARLPQPISILPSGSAFFTEGLFDRGLLGDAGQLRQIGFGKVFRRMILFSIAAPQTAVHRELEGFTRCEIKVRLAEIDPSTGVVTSNREALLEGKGFSAATALASARTDADQKVASLIGMR